MRNFENVHYQHQNGSLDAATWEPWAARIRGALSSPGSQIWWSEQRLAFSTPFREFVEASGGPAAPIPSYGEMTDESWRPRPQ